MTTLRPASPPQPARPSRRAALRKVLRDPSAKLLIAQLVTAASGFTANILSSRALGPSGRGELAFLLQLAYFGSLGVLLGCDRSVVAVYTGRPARMVTRAFWRLLLRPSAATVAVTAAILVLPVPAIEGWRLRLLMAAAFTVVNAYGRAVRAIAIASGRTSGYLAYGITSEVLTIGSLSLLYVLDVDNSVLWLVAYTAAAVATAVPWLWWWGRSRRGGGAPLPTDTDTDTGADGTAAPGALDLRQRARREGLQLLPATLAHSGTLRLDRLVLAVLASTAALGLYTSVATMVEMLIWPVMVFADSRLGVWRQAHDRGSLSLRRVVALALLYSVVAGTALAAVLHVALVPVLGSRYAPALALMVPLIVANGLFGVSQVLITALTAVRRAGLSSVAETIGLCVSIVAYVTLIARYGALGAAYGSLIGYSTCLVVASVLLARVRRGRA